MNNFFELITVVLFSGMSLLAFFSVVVLLLPAPITKVQLTLEKSGGRSILLGLVNFIFLSILVILSIWLGERFGGFVAAVCALIALLSAIAFASLTVLRLIATAQLLGLRSGKESAPFVVILRGGGLLLLAGLTPYVGWFLFTPLAVWASLGAAILTFLPKRKVSLPTEE